MTLTRRIMLNDDVFFFFFFSYSPSCFLLCFVPFAGLDLITREIFGMNRFGRMDHYFIFAVLIAIYYFISANSGSVVDSLLVCCL